MGGGAGPAHKRLFLTLHQEVSFLGMRVDVAKPSRRTSGQGVSCSCDHEGCVSSSCPCFSLLFSFVTLMQRQGGGGTLLGLNVRTWLLLSNLFLLTFVLSQVALQAARQLCVT